MSKNDTSTMPTRAHLTRRAFLRRAGQLGIGAAGLSLLAACGGSPAAPATDAATAAPAAPAAPAATAPAAAASGEAVTISMMGWGSILEKDNVQKGLDLFQSKNPNIKVNWLHTPEDYETKLKTMLAGGTPPDVFWGNNMADYVSRGVVMDITERVKSDPVLGKADYFLQPQEEQRATINGKWYGIGSCWVIPHLYYNVDLLQQAGVEPPSSDPAKAWTWDQYLDIARKLTIDNAGKHPGEAGFDENNVKQWGVSWPTWSQMRDLGAFTNGGESYTPEYKLKLGEPAAIEGIQQIADLFNVHKVAPRAASMEQLGLNGMQMLSSGRLAIMTDGSWALQDIAKMNFKYGTGVLPKMKTAVTLAFAHMHLIHKDTKYPDQAWKLLAFLSSDDYQLGLIKAGLWLPSHTSLLTEAGLNSWLTPGVHPEGYKQIATDYLGKAARNYFYPAGYSESETIISAAMDPVWIGKSTVEQALKESDAITKAEEVLTKAHANLA